MHEQVTLLRPDTQPRDSKAVSPPLPPDLLQEVRGRLGVIALLMLLAFGIDPLLFFARWAGEALKEAPLPDTFYQFVGFYLADLGVVAVSFGLWLITRSPRISAAQFSTLALLYEITLCFVLAFTEYWEYYHVFGMLPNMTWVPAIVILFPLFVPAPPRRMLAVAIVAAGMQPLALLLLDLWGKVVSDAAQYINLTVGSVIAVGFAYMGSRVIYRLGREVVAARELGSYRLEEKLGQGGMGEVWRARHRMLARPAAIKLIRPSLVADGRTGVSSGAVRRFEREAQVIAQLRSPHTVDIFDFGMADNGAFYYVMELLDGLDADSLVRRTGPVPAERAIHLLRQVCHSLSEAESCGLVHRDIKPANIFLCRYGEEYDFVKVLDFGIVKAPDDPAEAGPALTQENAVQGTPAFIAPEQVIGGSDLDGRVDIYATGCVAYWLLTGQYVFTADTPMGLLFHHAHTPPTAPSTRTELPIPAALDQLVLSCLAKDRTKRPQSARELSRRLSEIPGADAWTEDRAGEWWAKHQPPRK